MVIVEKVLEQLKKNLPYEKHINYVKKLLHVFDSKIASCMLLIDKIIKNDHFSIIMPFLKVLVKKYFLFRHRINMIGYVASYYKIDIENIVLFHSNFYGYSEIK